MRWSEPGSDARFAWQWANWNEEERIARSGIAKSAADEAEQVMKWILTSSSVWGRCSWSLNWNENERKTSWRLYDYDQMADVDSDVLDEWQQWLWSRFFSGWRGDLLEQHECAREFWRFHTLVEVETDQPPTMHEQLEAKLQLREWLERNATANEIEACSRFSFRWKPFSSNRRRFCALPNRDEAK